MEITKELLEKVAKNARIELTEKEKEEFLPQLKDIIRSFSKINEAKTENLHPSFQAIPTKNVFREDHPKESLTQEQALQNTKHKKDGFFLGPKTI